MMRIMSRVMVIPMKAGVWMQTASERPAKPVASMMTSSVDEVTEAVDGGVEMLVREGVALLLLVFFPDSMPPTKRVSRCDNGASVPDRAAG